jgi:hypothetical protein
LKWQKESLHRVSPQISLLLQLCVIHQQVQQGKKDFIWSTAADELTQFTLATSGVAPTLVLAGKRYSIAVRTIELQRKQKEDCDYRSRYCNARCS